MKKLLFLFMLAFTVGITAQAQEMDKMKKTSTPIQKVHNTVSHHKKYKGYKVKHQHHGRLHKHKVDYKDGDVKNKSKN